MHMRVISAEKAIHWIDHLLDVEMSGDNEHGSLKGGYDFDLIVNSLGDYLMLLDNEHTLDYAKHKQELFRKWSESKIHSKDGLSGNHRAMQLLAMFIRKCFRSGRVVCEEKDELKMWRHFGELALSEHVLELRRVSLIDDAMSLLYDHVTDNALFTALVIGATEGHGMLAHVHRIDSSYLVVKLYNSGLGSPIRGGSGREDADEFLQSFEMFLIEKAPGQRLAHYFILIDHFIKESLQT